jgi:uncharacterized surface protein with fasciclin (FAS1) repeats
MKNIKNNFLKLTTLAIALGVGLVSCNKEFNDVAPVQQPAPFNIANSIDSLVRTNSNFTVLKAAIARAGLNSFLQDGTRQITVFAPDDAAFAAIGITSPAAVVALRPGQLDTILKCHILPQYLPSASIVTTAPNMLTPTFFAIAPTVSALVKYNLFPSKRGTNAYVNNVPITQADIMASNGIIHKIGKVLLPTTNTVKSVIASSAQHTYLRAAIARGDSGQVGLGKLDSVANYALANITVLAPVDSAMRVVLYGAFYPSVLANVSAQIRPGIVTMNPGFTTMQVDSAVAVNAQPIAMAQTTTLASTPSNFNLLPVTTVRGIVAYHIFGQRYFGINTQGAGPITTVGGTSLPNVTPDFNGGAVRFLGAGNGGSYSNVTTADIQCINGVVHIVDKVLLPQ